MMQRRGNLAYRRPRRLQEREETVAFEAHLFASRNDPNDEKLFDRIRNGVQAEREASLAQLIERAQLSQQPDDVCAAALGMHWAGRNSEARNVFSALVERHPDNDLFRLNLAAMHSQLGEIDLCRHQLRHLQEHAQDERTRSEAREQLAGYERFLGIGKDDLKFKELQLRSLRSRVTRGEATPADYLSLGRKLIQASMVEGSRDPLDEAVRWMTEGSKAFRRDVALIEHLVLCYLRSGQERLAHEAAIRLEKIFPRSEVLALLKRQPGDQEVKEWSESMQSRSHQLMLDVQNGDAAKQRAALAELARMVANAPSNPSYRLSYAFALLIVGDRAEGLKQAEALAAQRSDSHSFHFNLGQIFWGCGDSRRGREHLRLALEYAQSEEERQDVHERLTDL